MPIQREIVCLFVQRGAHEGASMFEGDICQDGNQRLNSTLVFVVLREKR